jgi:hypothetical protein
MFDKLRTMRHFRSLLYICGIGDRLLSSVLAGLQLKIGAEADWQSAAGWPPHTAAGLNNSAEFADVRPKSTIGRKKKLVGIASKLAFELLDSLGVDQILRSFAGLHQLHQLVA